MVSIVWYQKQNVKILSSTLLLTLFFTSCQLSTILSTFSTSSIFFPIHTLTLRTIEHTERRTCLGIAILGKASEGTHAYFGFQVTKLVILTFRLAIISSFSIASWICGGTIFAETHFRLRMTVSTILVAIGIFFACHWLL